MIFTKGMHNSTAIDLHTIDIYIQYAKKVTSTTKKIQKTLITQRKNMDLLL